MRRVTAVSALDVPKIAIYVYPMSETQKTTVYLDAADYKRLKAIARNLKRPPAALIREAVTEFTRRHSKRGLPRSIGMAKSGEGDLSGRVEELLEGLGSE